MTNLDFEIQVQRLKNTYGANHYANERVALLYEIVKECDVRDFENQISRWITDLKMAPLGEQFREFAKKSRSSKLLLENPQKEPECKNCSDSGWLQLEMKSELQEYAESYCYPTKCGILCPCKKGERVREMLSKQAEYRDISSRRFTYNHQQWYNIVNRWVKPTYGGGKTLEEFLSERMDQFKNNFI